MSETTDPHQQQQAEKNLVTVRHVTLMQVFRASETDGPKREFVALALGTQTGEVEHLAFTEKDALSLFGELARLHRKPWQPAPGCKRFCTPHSIWRAELDFDVEGFEYCLDKLIRDIREVGEFTRQELRYIGRSIERNFKCKRTARALINRLNRSVLLAIDAARYDT